MRGRTAWPISLARLLISSLRWEIPKAADVRILLLGAGRGIRDMSRLSALRLLLLSESVQNQDIDYRVYVVDLNTPALPVLIGVLQTEPNGQAVMMNALKPIFI